MHKKAVRSKCLNTWNAYKSLRNEVTSKIKVEKCIYFENELCNNVNDPKQFWKKINNVIDKKYMKQLLMIEVLKVLMITLLISVILL